MEKIILENKPYKIIGSGHEGIIKELNDNEVFKIFYNLDEKKTSKIIELSNLNINNFIFPKKLVLNKKNEILGYSMDKVNAKENMTKKMIIAKTVTEKIEYLKKLEKNLIEIHKKEAIIVDFNFSNFLIENNEIKMVDTDNYFYKNHKPDVYPLHYYYLYIEKVSKEFTPDMDKFQFAIKVLENLLSVSLYYYNLTHYHPYNKDLEKLIKRLDISDYMKEFFIEQISDTKDRPYFLDELDNLKSEKPYIYER